MSTTVSRMLTSSEHYPYSVNAPFLEELCTVHKDRVPLHPVYPMNKGIEQKGEGGERGKFSVVF